MKSPGYAVLLVIGLVAILAGCLQQPAVPVSTSAGTPAPIPLATQAIPSPCVSCNQVVPERIPVTTGTLPGSSLVTQYFQIPVADFVANRTSGRSPLVIGFSDRSSLSPVNWFWDFGDGAVSHEKNPIHVYINPGTYSVRLNASNDAGSNTATKVYYIIVMPEFQAPVASFGLSPQESPSGVLQFIDRSSGPPTKWSWNFGDGGTSDLENPVHSFVTPGNYLVSLTVSNPSGTGFTTRELVFGGSP
ncbi:MAG TPA: PKD domain-containing protein [Methanoregulaceae archaeon]|nr:PKD domain-containing protein [Methanoregulaceae archaeon]